jgi:hypothetical protein
MTAARRVDFVVAGAQRSGTTTLDHYLRRHSELCLPSDKKEIHFFDRDRHFATDIVDYGSYHAFFRPLPGQRLLGEVTPSYLYWPPAPERMARYNARLKLILLLRNPITRAFSHWNMARQNGIDPLPFLDALRMESERARTMSPDAVKRLAYIGRGLYAQQLKRLWQYFPRDQTIAFRSEDLSSSSATVLAGIAEFLGIAAFPAVRPKHAHTYHYDRAMNEEERQYLVTVFEPEIRELEGLLGWDCGAWLAGG